VGVFGASKGFSTLHQVRSTESATWLTKQQFVAQNSAHLAVAGECGNPTDVFSIDRILELQAAMRVGNKGSRQEFAARFRNRNSRAYFKTTRHDLPRG
jgi:hypothetical protein